MKLALFLAGAMTLVASQAAAQQATQFDLICKGKVGRRGKQTYEHRYRIDTEAKRWCFEACPAALEIQKVTPDQITFAEEDTDGPSGKRYVRHYVSRVDGKHVREFFDIPATGTPFSAEEEGSCEPAPFSGFPQPKF